MTAGVFGLDSAGRITLVNRSSLRLLRTKASLLIGRSFPESLQKGLRSLEQGRFGLNCDPA